MQAVEDAATSHWPAEWEPHARTWLAWPHNRETWPGDFPPVVDEYAAFVDAIATREPVSILTGPESAADIARALRPDHLERVAFHEVATNDAWIRDYGPSFVRADNGALAAVAGRYNAWGGKYPPFDHDVAVAAEIARICDVEFNSLPLVLEGGSLDGNGAGTVLTTESCVLNANRNPTATKAEVERLLCRRMGVRKLLWLKRAHLAGDDTDGHIDQLARFVDRRTVVVAQCDPSDSENAAPLSDTARQLAAMTNAHDEPLRVVPLPLPAPMHNQGQRLPASYCNFYIVNGAVLVPQFGDPADSTALAKLAELFPDRDCVPVRAHYLVRGLGALHCLTQQQPAT